MKLVGIGGGGDADDGGGVEEAFAGHGGGGQAGGQIVDIDVLFSESVGDIADDAAAVGAEEREEVLDRFSRLRGDIGIGLVVAIFSGLEMDEQATRFQGSERGLELFAGGRVDADEDDASELPREASKMGLMPVAAVVSDGLGEEINEAGLIVADDGEDVVGVHVCSLRKIRRT